MLGIHDYWLFVATTVASHVRDYFAGHPRAFVQLSRGSGVLLAALALRLATGGR